MTAIELNAKKMEIIEMLLAVDDENTVTNIMAYIRRTKSGTPPCRYSVEEVKKRIALAEEDIKNGAQRFIPHEEMKRKAMLQ
jgi:hypothetical protein